MADGPFDPETGELIPRDPTLEDLVSLCKELNVRGAQFIVVGGFAIRANGLARNTGDVDVLMDVSPEKRTPRFRGPGHPARRLCARIASRRCGQIHRRPRGR